MGLKEELLKLRRKISGRSEQENNIESIVLTDNGSLETEIVDLNDKVDAFIKWYQDNMINWIANDTTKFSHPKKIRDLIEKIAVWFELRYPDLDVDRKNDSSINNIMFKENPYIKNQLGDNTNLQELDWANFYNFDAFVRSLSWEERQFFSKPRYYYMIYLDQESYSFLRLTKTGKVKDAQYISFYTNGAVKDEELVGKNIRSVAKLFSERGIVLPKDNGIDATVKQVDNRTYMKEELLNCAMYRIIERGGKKEGPLRALLFAKEFNLNIDIPMMYAADSFYDHQLRLFINEYLKAGGSKDLECYVGYYSRKSKDDKLEKATVQDILLTQNGYYPSFYTEEEKELQERIVNAISSKIDYQELRKARDQEEKEMVKELRIQRKLTQSKLREL